MTVKEIFLTILLTPAVLFCGCNGSENIDVEPTARAASNEVCVVGKTSKGTKGAAILFLEENHTSRAGQIELAIVLVRLHALNGLKHIALEGYLKDDPKIETDWFKKAAQDDLMTRASVAVRLLKVGEISAAEFMKLVYDDIVLHPIEVKADHSVEISEEEDRAPLLYLLKIAEQSLREDHVPRLEQLEKEINKLSDEAKQVKVKELYDYILSTNLWTQEKAKIFLDAKVAKSMSAESFLAAAREIKARAQDLAVPISPNEESAMQGFIEFFEGRVNASKTMMLATGELADQQNITLVALNIGAAHTDGMASMAIAASRPFAVITPLSLNKDEVAGDLTIDMFDRKQRKLSIYSEGFMNTFLKVFTNPKQNQKKPPPDLEVPWLQANAELSLFAERITKGILGSPPPPGGGKPPYGFSDDDFNGKWIFIDPRLISVVEDKYAKSRAVLFKAILNHKNPELRMEMWCKTIFVSDGKVRPADQNQIVEILLKQSLGEVKIEPAPSKDAPSRKAEDKAGRVQITLNTVAAFGSSQEAVKKVSMTSS